MTTSAREDALRERFDRLQALRSAWGVLAPSGLSVEKRAVAETGRELGKALAELAQGLPSPTEEEAAIAALDARVAELERDMRDIALAVPVTQLRITLPERVSVDRRGVLDLLDLILGAEVDGLEGTRVRIPTLDYLITLLCTGGNPHAPLQDPVMLTPRLHQLCGRSNIDYDPRLPALEAEFYAAADMHEAEMRNEVEQRTLRRYKMELEEIFFAPRVLRAIVNYNAALMRRIEDEVLSSQDWGIQPRREGREELVSLFEVPALPKLAEALRRRTAGAPPAHDPLDRIAWCLDLSDLTQAEREALLAESTGRREGLEGTAILLGLLCRSAVVLDEEFPSIGIDSRELSGAWTQELGELLQQEVNRRITTDFSGARALSELKGKFLIPTGASASGSRVRRPVAPPIQTRDDAPERSEHDATQLTRQAVESLRREQATPGWRELPWARIARAGAAGVLVVGAIALVDAIGWGEGRVARAELERLSPLLHEGRRSDDGTGTAFAGTLDDEWTDLTPEQQTQAAQALVAALRERGVREIMIYDGEHQLRVQALGSQPAQIVR
jgi:hypothetical protein